MSLDYQIAKLRGNKVIWDGDNPIVGAFRYDGDWEGGHDYRPTTNKAQAMELFEEMAERHGVDFACDSLVEEYNDSYIMTLAICKAYLAWKKGQ